MTERIQGQGYKEGHLFTTSIHPKETVPPLKIVSRKPALETTAMTASVVKATEQNVPARKTEKENREWLTFIRNLSVLRSLSRQAATA